MASTEMTSTLASSTRRARTLRATLCVVIACLACVFARESAAAPRALDTRDAAAIAAYRAGDMAAARAAWENALSAEPRIEGDERARMLYDLGNVAYRQDRVAESVGWFTASLRLRPRDGDAWTNLERARRQAGLDPADRGDLQATVWRLLTSFTPSESRWLALIGLCLWGATLAFEALRGGRTARWFALGGAGLALLLSAPCLHAALTDVDRPVLVVEDVKALVRSEPRADAAVIGEAALGTEVEAIDDLPGWTKIRTDDGSEGWVGASAVFDLVR